MQQVRIHRTVYESGAAKYLAGQLYPATEDTLRQVALHNGDEVDVLTVEELEAEIAAAAAEKAAADAEAERLAAEKAEQATAAGKRAAKA